MGFKHVSIEELETRLSPNFLGTPLKHIEKIIKKEKIKKEIQISKIELPDIHLFAEDKIEYTYDNVGNLKDFIGSGSISVYNHSKKDRIWDARVKVAGSQNVNIDDEDEMILGNLEPLTNKKIKYNIFDSENLVNPIKLTERIKVLNIEAKGAKKLIIEKKAQIIADDDISVQVKEIGSKLAFEKENLKEADTIVADWTEKVKNSEKIVSSLTEARNSYTRTKSKTQGIIKKKFDVKKKKKEISNFSSSMKECENQIKIKKDDISKLINNYSKKEDNIKKEIENEFNPKIESAISQKSGKQEELEKANEKVSQWTANKNELDKTIKIQKRELSSLIKTKAKELKKAEESKIEGVNKEFDSNIKAKETKLVSNAETLDEANKTTNDWRAKKKELNKEIKELEKEIESLEKNKILSINMELKKLDKEKNTNIKEIEGQIKANENEIEKIKGLSLQEISSIKEIDEEYAPKIKEIESKLSEESKKLKDAKRNFEKWRKKKDNQIDYIQNLEKEYEALIQADPETQSIRLKRMLGEEGIEKFQPASGLNISELQKNHLLMFNKQNSLEFSIILENDTNYPMENITLGKAFSDDFSGFQCKSSKISEISINKGNIIWNVNEIKPAEVVELRITTEIIPEDKKIIGTGTMQLSYDYKDYLISGIDIESFSAYSHAMHAMRIKEKDNEPYKWDCSIFFQNNCQINMELRSILVLDETKQERYLDLKYDQEKLLISPGESYSTEKWEVSNENEPKFYRKLDYSVTYTTNKKTNINLKIEENVFNIVDAKISKKFSKTEIKSFEEDKIENLINIKNAGSIGIEEVLIEDYIPIDFRPPLTLNDIKIRNTSGILKSDNIELKLTPEDDDPSKSHVLHLMIKNGSKSSRDLIKINDFIEVRYDFDAVKPDYKVKYEFPLKITTLYPKYRGKNSDYYKIEEELSKAALPNLRIVHKRRNLIIGKSIFPGRNVDEFGISIMVNNKSNSEINDIKITDTISKSFELISSNLQGEISESDVDKSNVITFLIDSILPYQEKEIRYYLQNTSGEEIGYNELESYIFG